MRLLNYFKRVAIFIIFLSIFLLTNLSAALASEGECHLKHCLVPAPTVLGPLAGETVNTLRPAIIGLTWKTTIVKVYLDGQELTNVKQVKHADYYGSFYVQPDFNLTPGEHYVYTIAHSEKPSWYDQSKESIYIYFTVTAPPTTVTTQPTPQAPVAQTAEKEIAVLPTEETGEKVEISQAPQPEVGVAVKPGETAGNVSIGQEAVKEELAAETSASEADELNLQGAAGISDLGEILKDEFVTKEMKEKAKRNQVIGLSILALIIVFSVIWLVSDKRRWEKRLSEDEEGELPPPPEPPTKNQAKKSEPVIIKSREVSPPPVEPVKTAKEIDLAELKVDANKYFASPPPSPYSPYPSKTEDVRYVPVDRESSVNSDKAINDIEEQISQEEQDRLI